MKKLWAIVSIIAIAGSLACFVLSFFPFPQVAHYVLLGFGCLGVAFALMAFHEATHVLAVLMMRSALVAVHLCPFEYKEGAWYFGTNATAVDFKEPSKRKSAFIYFNGFLFTALLEAAFIVWFVRFRQDAALVCLIVNATYFLTVPFKGGDLYNFVVSLKKRTKGE